MAFEPTVTVSIRMKVDLGNYQNADVFVSLNQIPFGYTEADIDTVVVDTVTPCAERILKEVKAKCREIRGDKFEKIQGEAAFLSEAVISEAS